MKIYQYAVNYVTPSHEYKSFTVRATDPDEALTMLERSGVEYVAAQVLQYIGRDTWQEMACYDAPDTCN